MKNFLKNKTKYLFLIFRILTFLSIEIKFNKGKKFVVIKNLGFNLYLMNAY